MVKTSTTRATPVVADTVSWTSTPLLDPLYHCTSPMQSYETDTTIVVYSHDNVHVSYPWGTQQTLSILFEKNAGRFVRSEHRPNKYMCIL